MEIEADLYKEGYPEFLEEYQKYEAVCKKLEKLGYSLADARKAEAYFREGFRELKEQRGQAMREKRIAGRLLSKVYQKERGKGARNEMQERVL